MGDREKILISKLSDVHDKLKAHPYRDTFAEEFMGDYKYLLSEMSSIWASLIYRSEEREPEVQQLWRQFGYWIHDYRAELRTYADKYFPTKYFDYYERMLQATHEFLKTGELPTFFNIDCTWGEKGVRKDQVECYKLITKEMCGIDSPILPRFLPTTVTMQADESVVFEELQRTYPYNGWSKEKQKEFFASWKKDVKPVLDWINSQHEETEFKHAVWKSLKPIY